MAQLSPTAAAKEWRVGKSTIYREMNSGSLSFSMDDKGKRVIDLSEMVRVFGEPHQSKAVPQSTSEANERIRDLKESLERQDRQYTDQVQLLRDQIQAQGKQLDTQGKQIDTLIDSINNTSIMLSHQRHQEEEQHKTEGLGAETIKSPPSSEMMPTPQPAPVSVQLPPKRKKSFLSRMLAAAIED